MAVEKNAQQYAGLSRLSTERLHEMLRADFDSDQSDPELVSCILSILETRDGKSPSEKTALVEKAWQNFQSYFNTADGEDCSLFPIDEKAQNKASSCKKKGKLLRILATAAVVTIVLLSIVPPVFGSDGLFTVVGRWTDSLFGFSDNPTFSQNTGLDISDFASDNADLRQINSILSAYQDCRAVPSWIPDGFELESLNTVKHPQKTTVYAFFCRGEENLSIEISLRKQVTGELYEKDGTEVIIYSVNGTDHYIMENLGHCVCLWSEGDIRGSISGNVTLDEMYQIIDSIYTGG